MEQANYWMWMRRKVNDEKTTLVQASSWEEQAFAEDSSGLLGGCVWPPRSYSCSFCRREFRSAQALGGHMNVHRRDRARLKQSPTLQSESSSTSTLHLPNPSQVSTLVYNSPTPNPNSVIPSASRVSLLHKFNEHNLAISPSYSSNMVQESHARHSNLANMKVNHTLSDSKLEEEKKLTTQEIEFGIGGEYPKLDTDVSLNLVANLTRETTWCKDDDAEIISRKRKKIDATSLPFFLRPSSVNRYHIPSSVFGLNPGSIEEIDLELRLGDRPMLK